VAWRVEDGDLSKTSRRVGPGKGAKDAKAAKAFALAPLVRGSRKGDKEDKGDNSSSCPPSISVVTVCLIAKPSTNGDAQRIRFVVAQRVGTC
jgi:hypothetical protein